MRVNELAKKLGVSADTIRYYTRAGFVAPRKDQTNGYKSYRERDEQRLRFILSARQLGFSVADVAQILNEADGGKSACPTVRHLIALRLQQTTQRFDDMQNCASACSLHSTSGAVSRTGCPAATASAI
jgi:DNA-binding transcriptional MerR regulator